MLKDITLGQYFPGSSLLHRLDPRTKLISLVLYITTLFAARSFVGYGILLAVLLGLILVSRIRLSAFFKGLKPLALIIVLTAVLNLFYIRGGETLVKWWIFTVTDAGLKTAVMMVARIIMLISCSFLLTYTTTPMALTDGIERLMNPLKKLKVPVHEFAMMMSIALRFIPTLIEEADRITSAQKARGADFETGKLTDRAKALLPLLVPLFVSAFRRADELATAMEARCYHGGEGRTRMKKLEMRLADLLALLAMLLLFALILILPRLGY